MVNDFLELTTYPAHWVCAIFKDFVPVVVGLDGLVLYSDNKTLCFRFQLSCFEPLVCHYYYFNCLKLRILLHVLLSFSR